MERLKLVEPAASLWRMAGPTIEEALEALQDGPHEWRFGGGTILATRWGHRLSFDIDLTVTENADLRELTPDYKAGFERAIRQLGGEPKFAPGRYRIDFETGSIEICRLDPTPGTGEKRFTIEDREETVLSTTQILCGKLERAPRSPVRDVFDFIVARQADPCALAAAANSLYEGHARTSIGTSRKTRSTTTCDATGSSPKRRAGTYRRCASGRVRRGACCGTATRRCMGGVRRRARQRQAATGAAASELPTDRNQSGDCRRMSPRKETPAG